MPWISPSLRGYRVCSFLSWTFFFKNCSKSGFVSSSVYCGFLFNRKTSWNVSLTSEASTYPGRAGTNSPFSSLLAFISYGSEGGGGGGLINPLFVWNFWKTATRVSTVLTPHWEGENSERTTALVTGKWWLYFVHAPPPLRILFNSSVFRSWSLQWRSILASCNFLIAAVFQKNCIVLS